MKSLKSNLVKSIFTIVYLLFLHAPHATAQDSLYKKIDEIVQGEVKYDLFSGTILVAKEGKIIYAKSFGKSNKEQHINNSPETRYNLSSIQKSFTATLIMQLHQDGLLSIDDPLSKYFPECPFNTADEIKIKNLLNHTSGLGDYRSHERYQEESENYKEIADVLPLIYEIQPEFNPGEKFNYSNTGFLFLKAIIEQVEKKKFAEVLQQRIFDPLNMNSAVMSFGGDLISNKAYGHMLSSASQGFVKAIGEPAAYTGGGMYLSVMDLLKFDQALYTEKPLTEENKEIMWTVAKPSRYYGYGWVVVPFGGTTVIYHNGGSGGFNSEFRRYPEKGYTIIVLSNYEGGASELANKIDCMLLDQPYLITSEAEAYCRRGRMYRMQNEPEVALQSYLSALRLYKQGAVEKSIAKDIENGINSIGYSFVKTDDLLKAIEVFRINTENFPESANAFDSLAEAFLKSGMKDKAITNYEISLELNPNNEKAKEILDKLKN